MAEQNTTADQRAQSVLRALRSRQIYRRLALFALLLTLALIMLGAYVRLTDAGLGCPDWPGCYGHFTPTAASKHIEAAVATQGGELGPVSMSKAWSEMGHRYVATLLGLVILLLCALGWLWRKRLPGGPWLATFSLFVVILQGLFGMWTVTLLLMPIIVTGHLIGGLLTLCLMTWLWQRHTEELPVHISAPALSALARLQLPVTIGLVLLIGQILLGGWTSTNYAALACTDLPQCHGEWWPETNFALGFELIRELGKTASGEFLPFNALTAIHLSHRMGAVVVVCWLLLLAIAALRRRSVQRLGQALIAMAVLQFCLGVSNVWLSLPLPIAVAHNGGAAVLLIIVIMLKFRVSQART